MTNHVETVTLLSKLDSAEYVKIDISMNEFDVTKAEMKSTYSNIKQYVLENFGLKVSSLYISQVKKMCGLEVGENYNLSKKENNRFPTCPPHKVEAIMDAFKYFKLI